MSLYANIQFDASEELIRAVLVINDIEIPISGRNCKWYTNLLIKESDCVSLKGGGGHIKLVLSNNKMYHPEQVIFDEKYRINTYDYFGSVINYSLSGDKTNPKKMLVTFPGVSNFDNVNYRLSALTSLQSRLKNVMVVAFQDKESVFGNYMHESENGAPIYHAVKHFLKELCLQYGISLSDVIFYGNSKGGTIAIDYIKYFPDSKFFIDIPQMDLFNYASQNALMRYSLGEKTRRYYNFISYLPSVVNKNVTYSFAENDFDVSRDLPLKMFGGINIAMLKDMEHSGSAMELVKRQFTKIIQLINDKPSIRKEMIDIKLEFRNELLYAVRRLGAFKEEVLLKEVYAEIEFTKINESYSVSLNKSFNQTLIVSWINGFDILKHLSDGHYNLLLHVYYDFREFVYPLSKTIGVRDGNVFIQDA